MKTLGTALVFLTLLAVASAPFNFNLPQTNGAFFDWLFRRNDDEKNTIEPLEDATSGSVTRLNGWFKIKVVGTGNACLVKEFEIGKTVTEQFGDYATSDAFVNFFGEPECEEGDFGFAWGKIRANVVAAAYERGRDCLSRVISAVIRDPFHQYSFGNVGVRISGEAVGEAVALCET